MNSIVDNYFIIEIHNADKQGNNSTTIDMNSPNMELMNQFTTEEISTSVRKLNDMGYNAQINQPEKDKKSVVNINW